MPLALGAGALAALGHAPFGLWYAALFGFAALAWLQCDAPMPTRAALIGWCGGVGYFAVTLHWIVEPFLVDIARHGWMAPFALILMAGGLALFWALAGWVTGWIGGNRALIWAIALAGAEVLRGYVLTGFPWALPAYIWTDTWLIHMASVFGPYGLTLLTLFLVSLPFGLGRIWMGGAAALSGFALLAVYSFANGYDPERPVAVSGTVRLVQPNAPQDEKWDPDKALGFVDRQIAFTAAPKQGVDLVVWPETAVPYRLGTATPLLPRIASAGQGAPVVLGINRVENGRYHNALISVGADGQAGEVYDKVRLVPFGEFIPLGQLAQLVGLQSFAARDGYGFSPGAGVRLIDTPLGRALPLICYEAIFPQHPRALEERPDFLLQITNDAWFGNFPGPYQHLQQAQFRAAEQGLPLVRVANTGVSAMIDGHGRIIQNLPLNEAGFFDAALPEPFPPTLYARTGDIPVGVVILVTLVALIFARKRNTIA